MYQDASFTGGFTESQDAKWNGINERKRLVKCHFAKRTRQGEQRERAELHSGNAADKKKKKKQDRSMGEKRKRQEGDTDYYLNL